MYICLYVISLIFFRLGTKFMCFVCKIHLTSQEQLDRHIEGAKHFTNVHTSHDKAGIGTLRGRWTSNAVTTTAPSVAGTFLDFCFWRVAIK